MMIDWRREAKITSTPWLRYETRQNQTRACSSNFRCFAFDATSARLQFDLFPSIIKHSLVHTTYL